MLKVAKISESKTCHRACLSITLILLTLKKLNLLRQKNGSAELKIYIKPLKDKNARLVIRYIKNWADSAEIELCSSHIILCGLTVNRSELSNFTYTQPLATILSEK
jgi:hypothetical protein